MISGEDYKTLWSAKMSLDAWGQALSSFGTNEQRIAAGYCRDLMRWCQATVRGREARYALAQMVNRSGLMKTDTGELQAAVDGLSSEINTLLPAYCC